MYQSKLEIVKRDAKKVAPFVVGGALAVAVGTANATGGLVDVSAAITYITGELTTNIASIGVAIITLAALAMGIMWSKATFFG